MNNPSWKLLTCALALCAALSAAGCGESELRTGAAVVAQAAREARSEIEAAHKAGELDDAEAASITPTVDRLEKSAGNVASKLVGFDSLDAAGKRSLLSEFIDEGAAIATDFDALRVKSERARRRFAKVVRNIRRGNSAFRIALAALPAPKPQTAGK